MTAKDYITCRRVLWWMVFTGIAINFMFRVHLNLVLVAIVVPSNKTLIHRQCNGMVGNNSLITNLLIEIDENQYDNVTEQRESTQLFKWNEYEQGLATGAYYWAHMLTEIPGGIFAKKYGTKLVFGIGNLLTILLGFLLPIAIKYHLYALIIIRVIQGLVAGVVFPSTHNITAKWIPQNERSNFVSAYLGGSAGIGLTYPICAYIIHFVGWEAVFYIFSLIGIIWYIAWYFMVFDTPLQHPRISEQERDYILNNLDETLDDTGLNKSVPWKHILTSIPVWMTIITNWGAVWGYFTLLVQAPAYLAFVHGWSVNQVGVLSGLPHFFSVGFGWIFAQYSDWLLQSKRMTLTNVRKLATFCCTLAPALMVLGLSFSGCYPILAVSFMMIGIGLVGSVSSGPIANLVDLSPNYASILLGTTGLIVDMGGFLSPLFIGLIINDNPTLERWQLVFIMTAAIMGSGFIFHCIWGTAEQQPWNSHATIAENVKKNEMKEISLGKEQLEEKTLLPQ